MSSPRRTGKVDKMEMAKAINVAFFWAGETSFIFIKIYAQNKDETYKIWNNRI